MYNHNPGQPGGYFYTIIPLSIYLGTYRMVGLRLLIRAANLILDLNCLT